MEFQENVFYIFCFVLRCHHSCNRINTNAVKMKDEGVIVLSVLLMLTGITAALNGSYCCSDTTDDVFSDDNGRNTCFNEETNSTTRFSLRCSDSMTVILPNDTDFLVRLNPDATLGIMLDEVTEWTKIPPGK